MFNSIRHFFKKQIAVFRFFRSKWYVYHYTFLKDPELDEEFLHSRRYFEIIRDMRIGDTVYLHSPYLFCDIEVFKTDYDKGIHFRLVFGLINYIKYRYDESYFIE